jgi:hypothetical protein
MMADPMWEKSVRSVIDAMARPLVTSGSRVWIESCDAAADRVAVRAEHPADCADCVMTDEDLASLLQEALRRTHRQIVVTVNSSVPGA